MGILGDIIPNELKSPEGVAIAINPGLALANVGTISDIQRLKQQRKALRAQRRIADIQQQQSIINNLRAARKARAEIINAGANVGGTGSSAVEGGAGSVVSQFTGNVRTISELGALNDIVLNAQKKAAEWSAIGGVADNISNAFGGYQTIFNTPLKPSPASTQLQTGSFQARPSASIFDADTFSDIGFTTNY